MSRENHTGTRKRESGASGAKSLDDRHDRVRKDNKKRRRRTASLSFPRNLLLRTGVHKRGLSHSASAGTAVKKIQKYKHCMHDFFHTQDASLRGRKGGKHGVLHIGGLLQDLQNTPGRHAAAG